MAKRIVMLLSNAFRPDPRPYREALSLVRAGHEVKMLCWDRGEKLPKSELIDDIRVERIRIPSKHGLGVLQIFFLGLLWLRMILRLSKEEFDIVYCHDFDTLPCGLFLGLLRSKKKVIFDSHEVYSKMLGKNVFPLRGLINKLEKTLIGLADCVIVTCPAMKERYESYGAHKITVVGNWKKPEDFQFDYEILKKEKEALGITGELVISFISNLGPERIIKPLLEVVKDDRDLFLIVGGDGRQKTVVEKTAKKYPNIKYLGYVPEEKARVYTALSDIVYYGYDRNHGMAEFNAPNKLFEALAAGKAFLGGNFGQMGDIVRQEECGVALDDFSKEEIKNAISVMKDRTKLNFYQENALKAANEKYHWENAERQLLYAVETI
jgi:glycosyltransferase involved in cell wall biosynthesis